MRFYLLGMLTGFLLIPVGIALRAMVEIERVRRRTNRWLMSSESRPVALSTIMKRDILQAMEDAGAF